MKNVNIWASSAVILAGLSLTSCSVDSMVIQLERIQRIYSKSIERRSIKSANDNGRF